MIRIEARRAANGWTLPSVATQNRIIRRIPLGRAAERASDRIRVS